MNINEVGQQLASILSKSGSLFFSSTGDFSRDLTMGQIIKGKVLRSYDSGQYQVSFGGAEKTVDSAIPLKVGELVVGRVVSTGEQIEIKRLHQNAGSSSSIQTAANGSVLTSKWENLLIQTMREMNVKFNAQQRSDIIKTMKGAEQPQNIMLIAAALAKQNLNINRDLLQNIDRLMQQKNSIGLYAAQQSAPIVAMESAVTDVGAKAELVMQLSTAIKQLVEEQEQAANPEDGIEQLMEDENATARDSAEDDGFNQQQKKAFSNTWYLLNNQIEGSVNQRVATLPFWLGDKLIEVDVVMYEQKKNLLQNGEINSKKIVFSLDLEKLGHVDIEVVLSNKRAKITMLTGSSDSTQALLANGAALNEAVSEQSWSLDEMSYITKEAEGHNGVVKSVLEHYASQDSLSRLM